MDLMSRRKIFIATIDDKAEDTASLDGRVVRTVFVESSNQDKGIGRKRMEVVESVARKEGGEALVVPSSVTAEAFYTRLGFMPVRDNYHGEERTIITERSLE
ncbi:GNAT family N-acetyltransferase [Pseudomonadota bacterium 24LQ007]|tara:strand:- start:144 stop:449 length:306 start_codon:yes stop_codon:yes gene_type:complete